MKKLTQPVSAELRLEYADPDMGEISFVCTSLKNALGITPHVYFRGRWGIIPSRYGLDFPVWTLAERANYNVVLLRDADGKIASLAPLADVRIMLCLEIEPEVELKPQGEIEEAAPAPRKLHRRRNGDEAPLHEEEGERELEGEVTG